MGQDHLVGERGLQLRLPPPGFPSKPIPRPGMGQAGQGAHRASWRLVHSLIFGSGVNPDLVDLLLPALSSQSGPDPERAAGDLHIGQPVAAVPGNLEHPRSKLRTILGSRGVSSQAVQQLPHPLQLECGAKEAGKDEPTGHQIGRILLCDFHSLQIVFQ